MESDFKKFSREANAVAHILAGTMENTPFGFTRLTNIPSEIVEQIQSDENSIL